MSRAFVFVLISLFVSPDSYAREVENESFEKTAALYSELINRVADLSFLPEMAHPSVRAKINTNGRFKTLIFGKNEVEVDSAFWSLADQTSKIYLSEIKKICEECNLPSLEDLNQEVESKVNSGWVSKILSTTSDTMIDRYGGAFITLASRYGTAAGVVKVIGEIVEDALLVVFKMPNAHIFCEVITAFVVANSGGFNTFIRSFMNAGNVGYKHFTLMASLAATSLSVKRSLRQLTIEVPAFEINDTELIDFIEANPDNRVLNRVGNATTYALERSHNHSINNLGEHLKNFVHSRHKFNLFINKLMKAQDRLYLKLKARGLSDSESKKAENELKVYAYIHKKVFMERRYKRFFFLKKRKKITSLNSMSSKTNDLFRRSEFWFFSLKNELLEPVIKFRNKSVSSLEFQHKMADDPVSDYLTVNFSESEESQKFLKSLFSNLDVISDSSKSKKDRYLNFILVESFMRYLMPNSLNELVSRKLSELSHQNIKRLTKYKLRRQVGRILYETDLFLDILRFTSVTKRHKNPLINFYIRQYFLDILDVYKFIASIGNRRIDQESLKIFNNELGKKINNLKSKRFWIEKTEKSFSIKSLFSPLIRDGKLCVSLY